MLDMWVLLPYREPPVLNHADFVVFRCRTNQIAPRGRGRGHGRGRTNARGPEINPNDLVNFMTVLENMAAAMQATTEALGQQMNNHGNDGGYGASTASTCGTRRAACRVCYLFSHWGSIALVAMSLTSPIARTAKELELLQLKHGTMSVSEYTNKFEELFRHLHTPNQSKNIHLSLTHRRRDQESHEIKMATKQSTTTTLVHVNEDYIDMELVTSCSSNLCPPQKSYSREFEFQMTPLSSNEKDSTASVADELFYNGKLLPLHNVKSFSSLEDSNFPIITNTNTNNNHLFDDSFSNIISPSESCRLSSDFAVTPDEYLFEWSNCSSQINNNSNVLLPNNKKSSSSSWSKKLKQINVGQRIKNSRSYIRSLFFTKASSGSSRCKEYQDLKMKNKKNNHQFGMNIVEDDEFSSIHGRRSFSGVVQRHCGPSKSSYLSTSSSGSSSCSSSFSFSSSSGYNNNDLQFFKRNIINAANNCEIEGSIEGAIAHCKKSQQKFASPKVAICGKQENEELLPTIPRREVN
ncbi:uncharacterized protein LOC130962798 [Arachis stenosperma]|uniref:uncharacterized protein LOC130962798 n=1 Tax=Arachis stenosperma TaxID=217475 RepID=UPI0025AC03E8|nr:uncharacterized protein LOC130962798 [Arachis stenosperma]